MRREFSIYRTRGDVEGVDQSPLEEPTILKGGTVFRASTISIGARHLLVASCAEIWKSNNHIPGLNLIQDKIVKLLSKEKELESFESEVYASIVMKRANIPGVVHALGYIKNADSYNNAIIFANGGRYTLPVLGGTLGGSAWSSVVECGRVTLPT